MNINNYNRYSRQIRFAPIGESGQKKLAQSTAAIVGCGALGSIIAEILARAGVEKLLLMDRDVVEESNLQRQFLYETQDALEGIPKAEAARKRLAKVNKEVHCEVIVTSLTAQNIHQYLKSVDCILDGTDNFETRYLINDFAVQNNIPWIYGAAVGSYGLSMTIVPRQTPCLRCIFPQAPSAENSPTCETAGVIAPITATIGAMEAAEALKILSGNRENISHELVSIDLWHGPIRSLKVEKRPDCSICGAAANQATNASLPQSQDGLVAESLCGRNAVQITSAVGINKDLKQEAQRLAKRIDVLSQNKFLLRFRMHGKEASLFQDGRLIVWETTDEEIALEFYRKLFAT